MMTQPASVRRTILVTGGTGTLGRELVARFARATDASVVVITRGAAQPGFAALPSGVETLTGDVRHGATLGLDEPEHATLRERVTDIVHCAADTAFNRPL